MPHIPDLRAHDAHDLELVAAFAAGDAAGTDLETATALVAGCAECAALHHDLRAIAAALPALPAPVRRRDFRLTPEQAGSLRPAGWRRLLGTLAGPSFRFAAPLGTGLATLGLVGILAGSLASVPLGAGGTTAGDAARNGAAGAAGAELAPGSSPIDNVVVQGEPSMAPAPAEGPVAMKPAPSETPADVGTELALDQDTGPSPWLILSLAAVIGGAVLLTGRLLARRLVR